MKKSRITNIVMLVMMGLMLIIPCANAEAVEETSTAIDLTDIIIAIVNAGVVVIGALLTGKIIPALKERMTESQFERMMAFVNIGVYAAEEIYKAGHGDEKLAYVQQYLKTKGFDVDVEQIKAAVLQMRIAEMGEAA